ncbi:MAG: hypothetical protein GX328_00940 [Clostridiaceae bacterium]|nr:hypothetical protein [Clostridiaceae bacterium]
MDKSKKRIIKIIILVWIVVIIGIVLYGRHLKRKQRWEELESIFTENSKSIDESISIKNSEIMSEWIKESIEESASQNVDKILESIREKNKD